MSTLQSCTAWVATTLKARSTLLRHPSANIVGCHRTEKATTRCRSKTKRSVGQQRDSEVADVDVKQAPGTRHQVGNGFADLVCAWGRTQRFAGLRRMAQLRDCLLQNYKY